MRTKEAIAIGSVYLAGTKEGDIYSWHITGEEIVRCRDCEYLGIEIYTYSDGEEYEINCCDELKDCYGDFKRVELDDYCAWGVRRND